ncbi:type VI secretion lipoprotein [Helicobacter cinaedi PAGU611]|uniref:type VI secretion system lipoprotein TssJ n=1 Tax=Helicobacter cinaedi TaxID=213 RepID=UPI00025D36A7|nr:type VI secretion system lipoprotein TssJ [Helicobacter cinaedi]QOQ95399.1 type VI secretion system lipoprotein TssJ [Helicobacter cinaedi]QOQ95444.1 type VI secretion system lipoprotein TssJ [Helicobacter cinaedi]BAM12629.1 type VI secretion lipoprotein [Helicobacter cinaedi PAGU611]BBB20338.1 type VI secretion lipoprotein/VasD [Helicobacter cinaedi]BBB20437.1 type VI secretion lipoprotein/VasD [Helicobacter cinaedi]
MYQKILILALCLLFGACSNNVSVKISNIEKSNLNNRFDDVPVTLIIYKLKDVKKFEEANDKDLITREDGALGKDKIDSIKLQIAPKSEIVAIKVKDKEVPYIGLLALFASDTKKVTKAWVKTKDVSGLWSRFWNEKTLKFEITQEGIKTIK